jgi:hypothetical protein
MSRLGDVMITLHHDVLGSATIGPRARDILAIESDLGAVFDGPGHLADVPVSVVYSFGVQGFGGLPYEAVNQSGRRSSAGISRRRCRAGPVPSCACGRLPVVSFRYEYQGVPG